MDNKFKNLVERESYDDLMDCISASYDLLMDSYSDFMHHIDEGKRPGPKEIIDLREKFEDLELHIRVFREETGV